ncbi:MAG: hypothetical protein ACRDRH_04465 [Pseudonocardia sp.]
MEDSISSSPSTAITPFDGEQVTQEPVRSLEEVAGQPYRQCLVAPRTPMPEIVKKLTIKTGKNTGEHPSVASLYRALADTDA